MANSYQGRWTKSFAVFLEFVQFLFVCFFLVSLKFMSFFIIKVYSKKKCQESGRKMLRSRVNAEQTITSYDGLPSGCCC